MKHIIQWRSSAAPKEPPPMRGRLRRSVAFGAKRRRLLLASGAMRRLPKRHRRMSSVALCATALLSGVRSCTMRSGRTWNKHLFPRNQNLFPRTQNNFPYSETFVETNQMIENWNSNEMTTITFWMYHLKLGLLLFELRKFVFERSDLRLDLLSGQQTVDLPSAHRACSMCVLPRAQTILMKPMRTRIGKHLDCIVFDTMQAYGAVPVLFQHALFQRQRRLFFRDRACIAMCANAICCAMFTLGMWGAGSTDLVTTPVAIVCQTRNSKRLFATRTSGGMLFPPKTNVKMSDLNSIQW